VISNNSQSQSKLQLDKETGLLYTPVDDLRGVCRKLFRGVHLLRLFRRGEEP